VWRPFGRNIIPRGLPSEVIKRHTNQTQKFQSYASVCVCVCARERVIFLFVSENKTKNKRPPRAHNSARSVRTAPLGTTTVMPVPFYKSFYCYYYLFSFARETAVLSDGLDDREMIRIGLRSRRAFRRILIKSRAPRSPDARTYNCYDKTAFYINALAASAGAVRRLSSFAKRECIKINGHTQLLSAWTRAARSGSARFLKESSVRCNCYDPISVDLILYDLQSITRISTFDLLTLIYTCD